MQRISTVVKDRVGVYVPSSVVEERKIELLDNLSIAVEKIQNEFDNPLHKKLVTDGKTTKYLCNCLEDIFQHGLREKLFQGSANTPDKLSFWAVIQKLSMKEDIQTIYRLSIIQTDANRCRAWIKMKLMDHTIGSYIGLLTDDSKLLRENYGSMAFLRDSVKVESVKTLLQYVIANLDFQLDVEENDRLLKTPSPCNSNSPVPVIGDTTTVETLQGELIKRRRSSKKKAKTPTSNIAHIKDFEIASKSSGHSSQHSSRRSSINSQSSVHSSSGYQRTLSTDGYVDKHRSVSQTRFEDQPRNDSDSGYQRTFSADHYVEKHRSVSKTRFEDQPRNYSGFRRTLSVDHYVVDKQRSGWQSRFENQPRNSSNSVSDLMTNKETTTQPTSEPGSCGSHAETKESNDFNRRPNSLNVVHPGASQEFAARIKSAHEDQQIITDTRLHQIEANTSNAVSNSSASTDAVQAGVSQDFAVRRKSSHVEESVKCDTRPSKMEAKESSAINNRPSSSDVSETGASQGSAASRDLHGQSHEEMMRILMELQIGNNKPLPVEKILEIIPQKHVTTESELKRYLDECIADYFSFGIIRNTTSNRTTNRQITQNSTQRRVKETATQEEYDVLDSSGVVASSSDKPEMVSKNEKQESAYRTDSDIGCMNVIGKETISVMRNKDSLNGDQDGSNEPHNGVMIDTLNEVVKDVPATNSRLCLDETKNDSLRATDAEKSISKIEDKNNSLLRHKEDSVPHENDVNTIINKDSINPSSTQTLSSPERDSLNIHSEAKTKELPQLTETEMSNDSDFNFVPGIYEEPKIHSKTRPIQSKRANTIGGFAVNSSRPSSATGPSRSLGNGSKQRSIGSSENQDLLFGFRVNSPSRDSPHSSLNTTQALMFDDENCISDSETETYDSNTTEERERIRSILADLGVNDDIVGLKEDHFATPDSFMGFTTGEELENAIETCKEKINTLPNKSEDRKQLVRKLVQLRLKLHEQKEAPSECLSHVKKILGHQFAKQGKASGNYFCDCCGSTIWALMHTLYKCIACSFYCHKKCLSAVDKPCVSKKVSGSMYVTDIAPECGMSTQQYRCADCRRRLIFRDGYFQARLCDYTGQFYCSNCHWNESQVIPARVIHNWDFLPRKISRQSKHLLNLLSTKPIICLKELNPALFNFVEDLRDVKALRDQILSMKSYLASCRLAFEEKMLLLLQDRQHFVENADMYSIQDLIAVYSGELLEDLSRITATFCKHIKFDCILCQGKGFICEICRTGDVIYPFDFSSQVCANCQAVFHRACLRRVSCPKCIRIAQRKS